MSGDSANGHWLAITMITAPRARRTVDDTLAALRTGGFGQLVRVFAEPGAQVAPQNDVIVHEHPTRLGLWENWLHAARFALAQTDAPYLLLCEDDFTLCPGAADTLRRGLAGVEPHLLGVVSLYTPQYNVRNRSLVSGWQACTRGRGTWGALAFCFSRQSLAEILSTSAVARGGAPAHSDNIVGAGCLEVGRRFYHHVPSLAAHTGGDCSTVGHGNSPLFAAVGFSFEPEAQAKESVNHCSHLRPSSPSNGHDFLSSGAPLVSCLMATCDRPALAAQAIRCFQRQTWPQRELVIIDDGQASAAEPAGGDARIRYVRLNRRLRLGAKRNLACRLARGEFLVQWDDDDWHGPERLARQVAPLAAGAADVTGLADTVFYELAAGEFWRYGPAFARLFQGGVHDGTLAFRRRVWEEIARYPNGRRGNDHLLLRKLLARSVRLAAVPAGDDFLYLRHGGNIWKTVPDYRRYGAKRVSPPAWSEGDRRFYEQLRRQLAPAVAEPRESLEP